MTVQHSLNEEVAPDKGVPRKTRARLSKNTRNRNVFLHYRHMTRLATFRIFVFAMQPLLIRDLLRQLADHFARRIERLGQQRVTSGAQLRRTDLFAFLRLKLHRRFHDGCVALVDFKRPVLVTLALRRLFVDLEAAHIARGRAEAFLGNLVAHRTRYAIVRQAVR